MTPALRKIMLEDAFNPYQLSGNAAVYSVDGGESDATYRTNGLGRVKLIADRSGNSAVNCLVLNGAAGNNVSTPDAAPLRVQGDIAIVVDAASNNWASGSFQDLVTKRLDASDIGYALSVTSVGAVVARFSSDGNANVGELATSSALLGLSNFVRKRIAVTRSAGTVKFLTSDDGATWLPLGVDQTITNTGNIYASTRSVRIGATDSDAGNRFAGAMYSARIYSGIPTFLGGSGGTIVFDADFTRVAKLAATFTESSANAATVTINTSGDLGARISGARDSVEFAATKIGLLSTDALGRNLLTLDGSNDYYKSAPFSLSQPCSLYFVGTQVTWTGNDPIIEGNVADTGKIYQRPSSPGVGIYAGAGPIDLAATWPLATRAVLSVIFSGAASSVRLNTGSASRGNAGTGAMNGINLGWDGFAFGNIAFSELLVRSGADPEWLELKINRYLARKWAVAA